MTLGAGLLSEHEPLEMAEVSKMLGEDKWPTWRVRRWLRKANAVKKVNGRWITTAAEVKTAFEAVYHVIQEKKELEAYEAEYGG